MICDKQTPIIVISGPSGCGKSSLLKIIFSKIKNYYFSISTTTRAPRIGESDGIEYFFVSTEEFEKDIEAGEFLEWAKVHNNYYGTSLKPVKKALSEGKIVIFDIDVQGHKIIKEKLSDITTSVFVTTPSLTELSRRLHGRQTDSEEVIQKRLENAKNEIKQIEQYDFIVLNDDLQKAADEILSIIKASQLKSSLYNTNQLIKDWNN